MKKIMFAGVLTMAIFTATIATASDSNDACGTILCLGGVIMGGSGGASCTGYIQKYFDITRTKDGDFSPSRTFKARGNYLNGCTSDNSGTKAQIQAKYGKLPSSPGF